MITVCTKHLQEWQAKKVLLNSLNRVFVHFVQTYIRLYNNIYTHIRTPILTNFLVIDYTIYNHYIIYINKFVQFVQFMRVIAFKRTIFCKSFCTFCTFYHGHPPKIQHERLLYCTP